MNQYSTIVVRKENSTRNYTLFSTWLKRLCFIAFLLVLFTFSLGAGSDVQASDLTVTITFDLVVENGPDGASLGGATLTFQATFADFTTYGPGAIGGVVAPCSSHSLSVAGSILSDGVYIDPSGCLFDPGFPDFKNNNFLPLIFGGLAGGTSFNLNLIFTNFSSPPAGSPVSAGDFSDVLFAQFTGSDGTQYSIAPNTLQMMVTGGPTDGSGADADLSITKTDSPDPVIAGNNLVYTITVNNAGPGVAENVVVNDVLPAGVTLVSTSGCAEDPSGVANCTLGTIAANSSKQYTITVSVGSDVTGQLTNNASVSSSTSLINLNDDMVSETTTVNAETDLKITKTESSDPVIAGDNLTYTITVQNNGPSDAQDVVVNDVLPAGLTLVSTSGCAEDPGGVANCTLGTIAANSSKQYTITVSVGSDVTGQLTNNASVSSSTTTINQGDDSVMENTTVNVETDLQITKTDSPDPVVAGADLTYTMTVTNNGPSSSTGATVSDVLPSGVTFNSSSDCSEAGGTVTCAISALSASTSQQVSFTVTVDPGQTAAISNTATVSANETDPASGNDSSTETTTVNQPPKDFGDAPDPTYPTLLASNGARHILNTGPFLGAAVDAEADGQPDATATGDDGDVDGDDDDGVVFNDPLVPDSTIDVAVTASGIGKLSAWIDFDGNGSWLDTNEQVFTDVALIGGLNNLTFVVPSDAAGGKTFARFRFDQAGGLAPTGSAPDGEVEDYEVEIKKNECTLEAATDTNQVGTQHTVTVTVKQNNAVQQNVPVLFEVFKGPNQGVFGTTSGLTDASGQATFTYTGINTGTDSIKASGTVNGIPFECFAEKVWVNNQCTLEPVTAQNQVGHNHTVTATVTQNGNPVQGVIVNFNVFKGPNDGDNGTNPTNASGEAGFTYNGDGGVGVDSIRASGTINGIPFECVAEKVWVEAQVLQPEDFSAEDLFPMFNFVTNQFSFDIRIKNTSSKIMVPPLFVQFTEINTDPPGPPVTIANADGGGNTVGAFYDYSDLMGANNQLPPNELTGYKTWIFNDPGQVNFTFDSDVLATFQTAPFAKTVTAKGTLRGSVDVKNGTVTLLIGTTADVDDLTPVEIPSEFTLHQNYPNPFNPETTIGFGLPQASEVTINIYNLQGQLVRRLIGEQMQAGGHEIVWDARDDLGNSMPSGVYLYRIKADGFMEVRKLMLIR